MVQSIVLFGYWAFFALALVSPFMPMFLMWRLAGLSAVAYATAKLIDGPVHWSDKNISYVLGTAIVFLFSFIIALVIIIRFVVSERRQSLSVAAMVGPKTNPMLFFDFAALSAIGCAAGVWLTIILSYLLSGVSFGLNIDLGIAAIAAAIATAILKLSRRKVAITAAAIFAALAVSAFLGARQSGHILKAGEALADGRAWCLTTSSGPGAISEVHQLGFFALTKSNSYPHLGLLVSEGDNWKLKAHWSIRRQMFVNAGHAYEGVHACDPIRNFAKALENGVVEQNRYRSGLDRYAVFPELHPRVFTNRVSIRSDVLVGQDSVLPVVTERMNLIYNFGEPHMPNGAVSLTNIPNPSKLNASDLTGENRLIGVRPVNPH